LREKGIGALRPTPSKVEEFFQGALSEQGVAGLVEVIEVRFAGGKFGRGFHVQELGRVGTRVNVHQRA